MAAILLTSGPVSTHKAAGKIRKFLYCITIKHFLNAASDLVAADLGELVSMQVGVATRACHVFIKKPPGEATAGLLANPDLCTVEEYSSKYFRPCPACIGPKHRAKLLEYGYVTERQLQGGVGPGVESEGY